MDKNDNQHGAGNASSRNAREDEQANLLNRVLPARAFDYLPDEDKYLSKTPDPLFGFAVIGCGNMGQEHIRNTLLEGRADIVGLYDPAPLSVQAAQRTAAKMGATPKVYGGIDEICKDPSVDAIFICSPNFTHLEVLQQVSKCGKALFLEKPVATTLSDAREVCEILAAQESVVRIGLQYRYKAIYAEAIREVLGQGVVGAVKSVAMLEHRFPFLDKVGQWNKFNRFTGGTLIEKCCHYFDLLNLFAQSRPARIFAAGTQAVNFQDFTYRNERADGLDQANVVIEYDNGVLGNFSLCMFVPGSREELTVCGARGRLFASETARLGEANQNYLDIWQGDHGASRTSYPEYPPHIHRAGHHGSTFFEHVAFVDDLMAGKNTGPSLSDAMWSVVVGAAAQESVATGVAVEIEPFLHAQLGVTSIAEYEK